MSLGFSFILVSFALLQIGLCEQVGCTGEHCLGGDEVQLLQRRDSNSGFRVGSNKSAEGQQCSAAHENCKYTKCCQNEGYTCFEKNEHYASCHWSCQPGIHDSDLPQYQTPWSCNILERDVCSQAHENCLQSRCCENEGYRCYQKNEHYASCHYSCQQGIHDNDPLEHQTPWSCIDITKPDEEGCADYKQNCIKSGCCKNSQQTCFQKNEHYAHCDYSCRRGINYHDPPEHRTPWSCNVITKPDREGCADYKQNCINSGCCKNSQQTCFKKNQHYAHCDYTCRRGINYHDPPEHRTPWSCEVIR